MLDAECRGLLWPVTQKVITQLWRVAEKRGRTMDWLIFNAGVSEVYAFDWVVVTKQFLFDTMMSFTLPRYMVERVGSVTDDGIPLVFQANTFGHYYIVSAIVGQSLW
jgi:3-keto steroid reductase